MRRLGLIAVLMFCLPVVPASAAIMTELAGTAGCRAAIAAVERGRGSPPGLLGAIAHVESGRRDPATGRVNPWPWTADVEGTGYFYETKEAAVAAVRRFQARGIRSIDVGCMQVNLQQHPDAFASVEAAFDPATNVAYAARFLGDLHEQTGDWAKATAMYHSATPAIGAAYQIKVLAALPEEEQAAMMQPSPVARAWAASLSGTGLGGTRSGGNPFGTSGGITGFAARRPPGARFLPVVATGVGGAAPPGRSLAAYRAMPVMMAPVMTALQLRAPVFAHR